MTARDRSTALTVSAFGFDLPPHLIAQAPAPERDQSRLMIVPAVGAVGHRVFRELSAMLRPGDLLVRNNAKVYPARLQGRRSSGGAVEILLDGAPRPDGSWLAWCRPARRLRPGEVLHLAAGTHARVLARLPSGHFHLALETPTEFALWLAEYGTVPLPPYIDPAATTGHRERYQTLYAAAGHASAAPTAGLHFTPAVFDALRARGIAVADLTLDVGTGTFAPLRQETLAENRLHAETYAIPEATAQAVNAARREGRRIIAVGTTALRALESAWDGGQVTANRPRPSGGLEPRTTSLFITPGYEFHTVDVLLTNFHLPRSSLFVLVCAFAGLARMWAAYAEAIAQRYRFYSYGDAMLVERGTPVSP